MNNLKRIFSLGLATVMVIGMMVTGASAAFTDGDTIAANKTDAVNTMVALKIISGIPQADGSMSFNPKGDVTRAQMATMIAVALNGGNADFRGSSVTGYPDVDGTASAWAGKYIKYCIDKGIISGKVTGKVFDPEGKVTAQEASAMILLAMGYKKAQLAAPAGSADWASKINERAEATGLYNDTDVVDYAEAIDRENAAKMIYTGITAGTPVWVEKFDSVNGTTYEMDGSKKGPSILEDAYKASIKYGVITEQSESKGEFTYNINSSAEDTAAFGTKGDTNALITTVDASEYFMNRVQIIYSGTVAKDGKATVISIVPTENNVLETGAIADLEWDAKKTTLNGFKINEKDNDITKLPAYVDFNKTAKTVSEKDGAVSIDTANVYDTYTLIDNNGDSKVDAILVNTVAVDTVSKITETKNPDDTITTVIKLGTAGDKTVGTKFVAYEGVAEDDIVLVTVNSKGETVITKADIISNVTATAKSADENPVYTIGGVDYTLDKGVTVNLDGKGYDLVVVNGVVLKADLYKESEAPVTTLDLSNVAIVTAAAKELANITDELGNKTTAKTQKVELLFTDGTKKIVDVDAIGDTAVTSTLVKADKGMYTYIVKDGVYTLTAMDKDTFKDAKYGYSDKTDKIEKGRQGTLRISADGLFFVAYTPDGKDATIKVMTGAEINAWETATETLNASALYTKANETGFVYASFGLIDLNDKDLPGAKAASDAYGYIVSAQDKWDAAANDGKGTSRVEVTLWNGTENITVFTDGKNVKTAAADIAKMTYVTYNVTGGELVKLADAKPTAKAVTAYDGTEIELKGEAKPFAMKDVEVFFIDEVNCVGVAEGTIKLAAKDDKGAEITNVRVIMNEKGDGIVALFVEINNEVK